MVVYSRPLRYHNRTQHPLLTGEEKGIDVRIALNVIALAHHREGDHLKTIPLIKAYDPVSPLLPVCGNSY